MAVVDEYLHGRAASIPKAKDHTREGVLLQRLLAQPHESVDPLTKIGRLDGHQDPGDPTLMGCAVDSRDVHAAVAEDLGHVGQASGPIRDLD